jgi:GH24 family phage-related lysozyme (muramidase)
MPVRVTEIPGFQSQQINSPGMSGRDPGAQALGSLAQSVANVSDELGAHAQSLQKVENGRSISEARQNLAKDYAAFQIDNQKVTDPSERIAKADAFLSSQKANFDQPGFNPYVRDTLTAHYDEFATRAFISAREDAANLEIKRAGIALTNEITAAEDANDPVRHTRALDTAEHAGVILPEQRMALENSFKKKAQERITTDAILSDPDLWLTENPKPKPNQPRSEWERYQSMAKSKFREETAETSGQILDGIASKDINTPEQIEKLAGNLRPTARQHLLDTLAARDNAARQAELRSPEVQNQIIGQTVAKLDAYQPNGDNFDAGYVEIDSMLRQLPPSAIRDELQKTLDTKRKDENERIETHADEARAALKDHYNTRFKNLATTTEFNTQRAINDGFLLSKNKLFSLGFDSDQVEQIHEAESDAERKGLFRTLASQRKGENRASAFTQATAEAILNGESTFSIADPEAEGRRILEQEALEKSQGKAMREFSDWLSTTGKDADETRINEKIYELAGKDTRAKLESGIFEEEESAAPKGADPSTSALPIGTDLKSVIKQFEAGGAKDGFHRAAYWDYGQWSIGYGTKSKEGEVIDKDEAERRLSTELASHRFRVEKEASRLRLAFTSAETDALTSFDYNTGAITKLLANGTRTKAEIADTMLLYIHADGSKLNGLKKRRSAERHLFLNGYAGESVTADEPTLLDDILND